MRTIDWTYSDTGDITYHDELLPGSCRPWVLLERRSVTIAGRSKKAFRFQVEPPADAPRGECRFMIAIEGVEPAQQTVIRRSEEHTSELQSRLHLVCRLLLEKKKHPNTDH